MTTSSTASVTASATSGSGGAGSAAGTTTSMGGSHAGGSTSDAGSLGGMAGMAGAGDLVPVSCNFDVNHTASSAIGTVRIVTWSTDLRGVRDAHIDFGLTDSELAFTAPVDLAEPDYRTLLLGMKGNRSYNFRIVANSDSETCTSPEFSFTTDPIPEWVPTITKGGSGTNAARGFIVTTSGLDLNQVDNRNLPSVFIFDTDGDVVWWTTNETEDISSARMSWDGKTMWSVCAYRATVFSVSMDGLVAREYPQLDRAHHDLAVLPDGSIATMIEGSSEAPGSFVEMKPDGSVVTIVPDIKSLFYMRGDHPNAVHYYPDEDMYTLSELTSGSIVKFSRAGELVWQLSGIYFLTDSFELEDPEKWTGNHGHQLSADGHLLFFNNYPNIDTETETDTSVIYEILLDQEGEAATKTWQYQDAYSSGQLGDVQRLPNGNVLITYSNMARIIEVTRSGEVVQSFDNDLYESADARFGYATFRTSLYGPPPR